MIVGREVCGEIDSIQDFMYNTRIYNGSESKCGVTLNGVNYLLKRQKSNWNNVLSEYVASNVIKQLGGFVHDTVLALEGSELVVLCKDFTDEFGDLKSVDALSESSIDTERSQHKYYFEDIIYELSKVVQCDLENVQRLFLEMYTFDTILGNPDRHMANWGLIKTGNTYKFAPIFDNGASLFPRADMHMISEDWMRERIYTFPNSKIMFNGKRERSSYFEIWQSNILSKDIKEWARSLDIQKAVDWIFNNRQLTEQEKAFYATIIVHRFKAIIRQEEFVWR